MRETHATCTCPSGDGSLRWPCPAHPPAAPPERDLYAEEWRELYRLREAVKGPPGYDTWQDAATAERARRVKAEQALAQAGERQSADDIREPVNGERWRVHWWNESCRMLLPAGARIDSFQSYKNGTLQFTIKRETHHDA